MIKPNRDSTVARMVAARESRQFQTITSLHNHWARTSPQRGYYWYLTFPYESGLQQLVRQCQSRIAFPYYDLTDPSRLHMTLDRVAFEDSLSRADLRTVIDRAVETCQQISPITIHVGGLGGTAGALGLSAWPPEPLAKLRDQLRISTSAAITSTAFKHNHFHPHIAIAYSNSNQSAKEIGSIIEDMKLTEFATIRITEIDLVLLEKRERSYSWQITARIPLLGSSD